MLKVANHLQIATLAKQEIIAQQPDWSLQEQELVQLDITVLADRLHQLPSLTNVKRDTTVQLEQ